MKKKVLIVMISLIISIVIGITWGSIVFWSQYGKSSGGGCYATEEQQMRMFNESFTSYLGEDVSGPQIKGLISATIASNSKEPKHKVKINGDEPGTNPKIGQISTKKYYSAIEEKDDEGYIVNINIKEIK